MAADNVVNQQPKEVQRPLVVAGVPRSGTTWAMRVLEGDPSVIGLMEPDNESRSAPAIWAKRGIGRFPVLTPDDSHHDYRRLWSWIFKGAPENVRLHASRPLLRAVRPAGRRRFYQGRFSPLMQLAGVIGARPPLGRPGPSGSRRLLVKTVHAPLAVDWLADQFDIDVLILLRHPANVLASWISLDLNDQFARLGERPAVRTRIDAGVIPPPGSDPLERLVWQIGVLTLGLEDAAARHPEWTVRTHEDLCIGPAAKFEHLFGVLGLSWTERAAQYLASNDRPGEGFPTQRVASDQPDAWKSRLTDEQVATLGRVLSRFPLATWRDADFRR